MDKLKQKLKIDFEKNSRKAYLKMASYNIPGLILYLAFTSLFPEEHIDSGYIAIWVYVIYTLTLSTLYLIAKFKLQKEYKQQIADLNQQSINYY